MIWVIVLPAKSESKPVPAIQPSAASTYHHLKHTVQLLTLALVFLITCMVTWCYGVNVGLSFGLGGMAGLVYFRLLSRRVDNLGAGSDPLSKARLAIFVAVIVVAARWQSLYILPTFLGFLTYKLAILGLMIQDLTGSDHT